MFGIATGASKVLFNLMDLRKICCLTSLLAAWCSPQNHLISKVVGTMVRTPTMGICAFGTPTMRNEREAHAQLAERVRQDRQYRYPRQHYAPPRRVPGWVVWALLALIGFLLGA